MKLRHLRLSQVQAKNLLNFFVADATARTAAEFVGVNKNAAAFFFSKMRKIIAYNLEKDEEIFDGPIEVDESYSGGVRKGKRGRYASGKVTVFGLLKKNGKVYAQIVKDTKRTTLKHIIRSRVKPDALVYSDKYSSYNFLNAACFRHQRINHSKEFVRGMNHINGVENFWNQAKWRLRKFNGLQKDGFNLFLQECVWRFNYPSSKLQLQILKKWIKIYHKEVETKGKK